MKYLIAPKEEEKGTGELDFSFTTPGEPLVPGSKCSSGSPMDECGCCRAFVGAFSLKGTTIGVVSETNLTPQQIARQWAVRFGRDELDAAKISQIAKDYESHVKAMAEDMQQFDIGTRVGFAFQPEEGSFGLKVFVAGTEDVPYGR